MQEEKHQRRAQNCRVCRDPHCMALLGQDFLMNTVASSVLSSLLDRSMISMISDARYR